MTTGSGPPPRESPRRAAHAPTPPPPQRPPTGGATQPVPAPRPLVPAQSERSGGGWLSVLGSHRVVIAVSTLVVIAALGILVYAWYDQTVKPRRALALQVGDQRYSMEYFSKRYKQAIEDPANANSLRTSLFTGLPERVADTLETDSIVLQRADALGITASD